MGAIGGIMTSAGNSEYIGYIQIKKLCKMQQPTTHWNRDTMVNNPIHEGSWRNRGKLFIESTD